MQPISNSLRKAVSALKLKKYREKHSQFVVEGPNLVISALRQKNYSVKAIVGLEEDLFRLGTESRVDVAMYIASDKQMKQMSSLHNHYRVLAVLQLPEQIELPMLIDRKYSRILLWDGIQDPGNAGTMIRSAVWFGYQAICSMPGTVDIFNPKVIQASSGSFFDMVFLPIQLDDLRSLLGQGYELLTADLQGVSYTECKASKKHILCIGSEGNGPSDPVKALTDTFIHIPPKTATLTDSLNASVSASILMATI